MAVGTVVWLIGFWNWFVIWNEEVDWTVKGGEVQREGNTVWLWIDFNGFG